MISLTHVQTMARYNRWQNRSLYAAADTLNDAQRREDRGAFFDALHTTLAHILWADRVWMSRFADTPSVIHEDAQGRGPAYQDWEILRADREAFDEKIIVWSMNLSENWLAADFTWTNTAGTITSTQAAWRLVTHFFNHQTHHRGQAHALLTAFGTNPEYTDLFLMPDNA